MAVVSTGQLLVLYLIDSGVGVLTCRMLNILTIFINSAQLYDSPSTFRRIADALHNFELPLTPTVDAIILPLVNTPLYDSSLGDIEVSTPLDPSMRTHSLLEPPPRRGLRSVNNPSLAHPNVVFSAYGGGPTSDPSDELLAAHLFNYAFSSIMLSVVLQRLLLSLKLFVLQMLLSGCKLLLSSGCNSLMVAL